MTPAVTMIVPTERLSLNRSCTNTTQVSVSEMVEVMAAIMMRKKNMDDHRLESGRLLNRPGTVMKSSPGPPFTSSWVTAALSGASAKAAGNITRPARMATSVSSRETWAAVLNRCASCLK